MTLKLVMYKSAFLATDVSMYHIVFISITLGICFFLTFDYSALLATDVCKYHIAPTYITLAICL